MHFPNIKKNKMTSE